MDEKKRAIEFGKRLREVRKKKKDSLRNVEARSGLNSGYLSQLENGKILNPSPSVLQKVALGYELRFDELLRWTGYVEEEGDPTTNQAVALSTLSDLGEPSDEELETLQAIVKLLKAKRAAPYSGTGLDRRLDPEAARLVRVHALALLREADALGRRPTPLEDAQEAARLVLTDEITLTLEDKKRLFEQFGHWVNRAWRRLQGTFDYRASEIWVKPDLHPSKRRFVIGHEIGHAILPAHKEFYAYIDDSTRLGPQVSELFEREANQAAAELIFQGGQASEEFDDSPPSLGQICRVAEGFGGSIVAAARYVVENSRRPLALVLAHSSRESGRLGPPHVHLSPRFDRAFAWPAAAPWEEIRESLCSARRGGEETWSAPDRHEQDRVLLVQKMHTGFTALVLVVPESRARGIKRVLLPTVRPPSATA